MDEPLGIRIRMARIEAGYSLSELARRTYISKSHLSRIETGKKGVSPELLGALSNELGVRLAAPTTTYLGASSPAAAKRWCPFVSPTGAWLSP